MEQVDNDFLANARGFAEEHFVVPVDDLLSLLPQFFGLGISNPGSRVHVFLLCIRNISQEQRVCVDQKACRYQNFILQTALGKNTRTVNRSSSPVSKKWLWIR